MEGVDDNGYPSMLSFEIRRDMNEFTMKYVRPLEWMIIAWVRAVQYTVNKSFASSSFLVVSQSSLGRTETNTTTYPQYPILENAVGKNHKYDDVINA